MPGSDVISSREGTLALNHHTLSSRSICYRCLLFKPCLCPPAPTPRPVHSLVVGTGPLPASELSPVQVCRHSRQHVAFNFSGTYHETQGWSPALCQISKGSCRLGSECSGFAICKGTTHWAVSPLASRPHSDFLFLSPGGQHCPFSRNCKFFRHFFSFFSKMLCSNGLFNNGRSLT